MFINLNCVINTMDEIVPPSEKNMFKRFICEQNGIQYYQLHIKTKSDKANQSSNK